jgi:perosamine synthetase
MNRTFREIAISSPRVGEDEARAVYEAVKSGQLCEGPRVREFESEFARMVGVKHAVVCFNGTVALHLLWRILEVGQGDEVIVPSLTFISTAVSLLYVGAVPVFAEVDPVSFNIDPEDVKRKITARTKAVMPVHYAGQIADIEALLKLSDEHSIVVSEDAAEAAGAFFRGRHAGSFGKASIFSFTPTKNMTTGEGGLIATDDDALAERTRLLKNHGMDREYHHVEAGYNYRMTEMQAAMGLVQFRKLNENIEIKNRNAAYLTGELSKIDGIIPPQVLPDRNHTFMIYSIRIDEKKLGIPRDTVLKGLRDRGIQAKIYFPPAHLQPVFRGMGHTEGELPVTEALSKSIISLPIHTRLTEDDLSHMVHSIKEILQEERA